MLDLSEFDARYFEGSTQRYGHTAGYSSYSRCANSIKIMVQHVVEQYKLKPCKTLVLGCAYGYEVEMFRELGFDAIGIDISEFAIKQAKPEIQPYLRNQDILLSVNHFTTTEWDLIYSANFLECLADGDLAFLIKWMNMVSVQQVHKVSPHLRKDFYNSKEIEDWRKLPFKEGTIIL